jgi:hypothetical protein
MQIEKLITDDDDDDYGEDMPNPKIILKRTYK